MLSRRRICLLLGVLAACRAAPEDAPPTLPPILVRAQRVQAACEDVKGHQAWADCLHRGTYPEVYQTR